MRINAERSFERGIGVEEDQHARNQQCQQVYAFSRHGLQPEKLLKFTKNRAESVAQVAHRTMLHLFREIGLILSPNPSLNI